MSPGRLVVLVLAEILGIIAVAVWLGRRERTVLARRHTVTIGLPNTTLFFVAELAFSALLTALGIETLSASPSWVRAWVDSGALALAFAGVWALGTFHLVPWLAVRVWPAGTMTLSPEAFRWQVSGDRGQIDLARPFALARPSTGSR